MRTAYLQHGRRHGPTGSDPIPGSWRIAFGQVTDDTTPYDHGSGDWTVDTDFSGTLTITFDPPFSAVPTVVVAENDASSNPPSFIQVGLVTVDTVVVYTYDIGGSLDNDIGFNFVAVGP